MKLLVAGWAIVVWTVAVQPSWLIGPHSFLGSLLTGTQGYPGFEGIEAVLILGTLPVLVHLARQHETT